MSLRCFSRQLVVRNVLKSFNNIVHHRCLTSDTIDSWLKKYENVVGLTDVKSAQDNVIDAEKKFHATQNERRNCQTKMMDVQNHLKDIHARLEKLQRGDERYLALLTEEYDVLKNEKALLQKLKHSEQEEHNHFAALSSALRESHEKERSRAERTKYWSVIGSVIGVTLGIMGTSINNHLKMRELRNMVETGNVNNYELKNILGQLSQVAQSQYGQTVAFLSDLQTLLFDSGHTDKTKLPLKLASEGHQNVLIDQTATQTDLETIKQNQSTLEKDLEIIKKILVTTKESSDPHNVVYVGPELTEMLRGMEENLEWNIKKSAMTTVGLAYGTGFLAFSIIYLILKAAT